MVAIKIGIFVTGVDFNPLKLTFFGFFWMFPNKIE